MSHRLQRVFHRAFRWAFAATGVVLYVACAGPGDEDRESAVQRVAFGSCALQWEEQPIWDAVLAADPDLFLFLGDAIYADWDGKAVVPVTEDTLLRDWGALGAKPGFRRLRDRVPVMATWDNHDYGKHDGGAEFELREQSKEIFLDFFREPEGSARRETAGIHDARVFGPPGRRVQVILLDTRTFKGPFVHDPRPKEERAALGVVGKYLPNRDLEVTLLGEEQWDWLGRQLRIPAEVRLVASSTQIVADQKGMDEWGNFPHERQRLLNLVEQTGADGVVFLSGNVHFAELSRIDGPYPLYDATSSGLTHVEPEYGEAGNPYRAAGPFIELNFGLVEILWDAQPAPLLRFAAVGLNGALGYEHIVPLDSLRN